VKLTPGAVVILLLASSCARKTAGASPQGSDAGLQRPDPGIASTLESVKTPTAPMKTPKEECEDLMNAVLPFAKQMLSQHREFFPFGGTMSPSGEIAHTSGWTGAEHPPSSEVISILNGGFRAGAVAGTYKATALVYDVRTVPPGATAKQDAIAVNLDHRGDYSVVVMFPYVFSSAGELVVSAPFASPGARAIFPQ
jgi:hypothetical protein